jgi:hypothetical protein
LFILKAAGRRLAMTEIQAAIDKMEAAYDYWLKRYPGMAPTHVVLGEKSLNLFRGTKSHYYNQYDAGMRETVRGLPILIDNKRVNRMAWAYTDIPLEDR